MKPAATAAQTPYLLPRLALFLLAVGVVLILGQVHPLQRAAEPFWIALALGGIAVGIWHGAFDQVLAEETFAPRYGTGWRVPFYAAYLALAGAVLLVWYLLPVLALAGFLLYSAFHFGTEGQERLSPMDAVCGFALGWVPIAAACHWHPDAVQPIFGTMLHGDNTSVPALLHVAGASLLPAVLLTAVGILRQPHALTAEACLLGGELLLFRFCAPLPAFAVFFCLWHTPEHMVATSLDRSGVFQRRLLTEHLRRGAGPWLLSLAAMAAVGWFGRHSLLAYTGVLFITLSALTVPHMALGMLYERARQSASHRRQGPIASWNAQLTGKA